MLFVLVAGLAALCCYAFLRPGPEPVAAAPASEEEVQALKGRLERATYRERVRMLHKMTRGAWGG